jgi:hypothetical protein
MMAKRYREVATVDMLTKRGISLFLLYLQYIAVEPSFDKVAAKYGLEKIDGFNALREWAKLNGHEMPSWRSRGVSLSDQKRSISINIQQNRKTRAMIHKMIELKELEEEWDFLDEDEEKIEKLSTETNINNMSSDMNEEVKMVENDFKEYLELVMRQTCFAAGRRNTDIKFYSNDTGGYHLTFGKSYFKIEMTKIKEKEDTILVVMLFDNDLGLRIEKEITLGFVNKAPFFIVANIEQNGKCLADHCGLFIELTRQFEKDIV